MMIAAFTRGGVIDLMKLADDLRCVFTSDSLALIAYRTWAQRARRERRFNIARLLEALCASKTARAEHAFIEMGEVNTTMQNVDRALQGLEPEAIATGPITGRNPLARDLMERARVALAEDRDMRASEIGDLYVCSHCGFLREGQIVGSCPMCGTVPEAHRSFKAIEAMGTLGPHAINEFLSHTDSAMCKLVYQVDEQILATRPEIGSPSLKELIAHMTAVDVVFRERAWLLLETIDPVLPPAHPPRLDDSACACDQPLSELMAAFKQSRKQTLSLLRGLTSAAWHRRGFHEIYGEIDLVHQGNWMVNHERTHLVEMAQIRHDLLAAAHNDAADLPEVVMPDVCEGE